MARRKPVYASESTTRRQTQVLRALHGLGEGTVAAVQAALQRDGLDLSYAAVKSALRGLVQDGVLRTRSVGRATVYASAGTREENARAELTRWLRTFFRGDASAALVTFLDAAEAELSPQEIERLRERLRESGS